MSAPDRPALKAFILAAGKGTRLRPLTEATPKILAPVLGKPMLERLLAGLSAAGIRDAALNTHHLPDAVREYAERIGPRFPGLALRLFHEPELLGTGGALVNIRAFWNGAPLLVWNGDVLADVDPAALAGAHAAGGPDTLATLLVQERPEEHSRLLIDGAGRIVGIDSPARGGRRLLAELRDGAGAAAAAGAELRVRARARAFTGISLLAPALLERIARPGAFDLIDALLEVIAEGGIVRAHELGDAFWGTSGSPAELAGLERGLAKRPLLRKRYSAPEH